MLYIAMIFASAGLAGALVRVLSTGTETLVRPDTYALSRAEIYQLMNMYAIKMAGVFMISTSSIAMRTRIVPRWTALLGYALALFLLLSVGVITWTPMVFPAWVFLISICILIENFRGALRGHSLTSSAGM